MMDIIEFINRICDDGIEACKKDYEHDEQKLKGSVAGFEACRGRNPQQLMDLLALAGTNVATRYSQDDYWYYACFRCEVEWVCNCVSAVTRTSLAGHLPTARGFMKAAEILDVQLKGQDKDKEIHMIESNEELANDVVTHWPESSLQCQLARRLLVSDKRVKKLEEQLRPTRFHDVDEFYPSE